MLVCNIRYIQPEQIDPFFDWHVNAEKSNPQKHVIFGGDPSSPTWDEYLNGYDDSLQQYIIEIRNCIQQNKLVGKCASEITNDIYFEFSDGNLFSFSWRAWGDLMQAIVNKQEGYMTYYYYWKPSLLHQFCVIGFRPKLGNKLYWFLKRIHWNLMFFRF